MCLECKSWREYYQTDCYFYSEDNDMGAIIPWCSSRHCVLNDGDCNKDCKDYIIHPEIMKLIAKSKMKKDTEEE